MHFFYSLLSSGSRSRSRVAAYAGMSALALVALIALCSLAKPAQALPLGGRPELRRMLLETYSAAHELEHYHDNEGEVVILEPCGLFQAPDMPIVPCNETILGKEGPYPEQLPGEDDHDDTDHEHEFDYEAHLVSVFESFDADGDEMVSLEEFIEGLGYEMEDTEAQAANHESEEGEGEMDEPEEEEIIEETETEGASMPAQCVNARPMSARPPTSLPATPSQPLCPPAPVSPASPPPPYLPIMPHACAPIDCL